MKSLVSYSLVFAAAVLFSAAARAQIYIDTPDPTGQPTAASVIRTDEKNIDTLRRIDPSGSETVQLHEAGEKGSLLLEVNGLGLKLGRSYESEAWEELKNSRFYLTFCSDIELGFTALTGVTYDHPNEALPDFLDQTLGSSFHFGFTPIGIWMRLDRKGRSHLQLGMNYSVDNIRLTNPALTVRNDGQLLAPVALDEPAKKSILRYTNLGLVLRYKWTPIKKLHLGLSTHYDFLMNGCAITKKPKEKTDLSGFTTFRFGVGASVGYRHIGIFVRYTPTSLFKSSSGLQAQTLSYGVTLNF